MYKRPGADDDVPAARDELVGQHGQRARRGFVAAAAERDVDRAVARTPECSAGFVTRQQLFALAQQDGTDTALVGNDLLVIERQQRAIRVVAGDLVLDRTRDQHARRHRLEHGQQLAEAAAGERVDDRASRGQPSDRIHHPLPADGEPARRLDAARRASSPSTAS